MSRQSEMTGQQAGRQHLSGLLLTALVLLAPGAAQAGTADALVVTDVRGASFRPGQPVDPSVALTLADGQRLVLVSPAGKVIRLQGPFSGPPVAAGDAAASTDVAGALGTLMTQKVARSDKAGVVRGTGSQTEPPDPWLIDIERSGRRCLRPGQPVTLWRGTASDAADVRFSPADRSWLAQIHFAAGQGQAQLPASVPPPERGSFFARIGSGAESGLTLQTLPDSLSTDMMRVAWMEEKGCDGQALALLRQINPQAVADAATTAQMPEKKAARNRPRHPNHHHAQ